jgi:hypothetical protein
MGLPSLDVFDITSAIPTIALPPLAALMMRLACLELFDIPRTIVVVVIVVPLAALAALVVRLTSLDVTAALVLALAPLTTLVVWLTGLKVAGTILSISLAVALASLVVRLSCLKALEVTSTSFAFPPLAALVMGLPGLELQFVFIVVIGIFNQVAPILPSVSLSSLMVRLERGRAVSMRGLILLVKVLSDLQHACRPGRQLAWHVQERRAPLRREAMQRRSVKVPSPCTSGYSR